MQKGGCSHEQPEVRARHDLLSDLTRLGAHKMSRGEQLFGGHNLIVAGSKQEDWAAHYRGLDRASERYEPASCKLIVFKEPMNDLEIIGAGQIDRARVPFAKERDQPRAARSGDIIRNLQQIMNCFGLERWMFPELQQMRAADASISELHQLFEYRNRHIVGDP